MNFVELKGILNKPESNTLTFKKDTPKASVIAWYICQFANNDGGQIVVGVDDSRNIIGINPKIVRDALEKAHSLYDGTTQIKFDQVKDSKSKHVAIITVAKSLDPLNLHESLYHKRTIIDIDGAIKHGRKSNRQVDSANIPISHLSFSLVDSNVKTCFRTDVLVEAFIEMMKDVSAENPSNTCFFGVFGCWGRGKSYFLRLLHDILSEDHQKDYDYIEFNAWKHQKTPEIWYHLLNTLIESKSRWFRFCMWWRMNWKVLIAVLIIAIASFFAGYLTYNTPGDNGKQLTWLAVLSGSIALITAYFSYVNGLLDLASNKLRKVKLNANLGIQHEIERRIKWILKHWNGKFCCLKCPNRDRKVILAVEDIDRCDNESMIGIVEAMKLVLENDFVRRRLIVIAAIDGNKLIEAYSLKYGQADGISKSKAIGQMDKVFLSGISLPILNESEQIEFIENIAQQITEKTFAEQQSSETHSFQNDDVVEDDTNEESSISEDNDSIDNRNLDSIVKIIANEISTGVLVGAPPRKLRIIFYRMILANNLLRLKNQKFDTELMSQIIRRSVSASDKNDKTDSSILDIVVPY